MLSDAAEYFTLGILLDNVTELCKEKGITIKALEKELKFGNGTIRRWDTSKPAISAVVKVARYFDVSVDYLLGLTSYRKQSNLAVTAAELKLSESAMLALQAYSEVDSPYHKEKLETINRLLTDDLLDDTQSSLLYWLTRYLWSKSSSARWITFSDDGFEVPLQPILEDVLHGIQFNELYKDFLCNKTIQSMKQLREKIGKEDSKDGILQEND